MPGSLSQGPRQSRVTWGMAQGLLIALFLLLVWRPGVVGNLSNPIEWSTLDLWASLRQPRPSHKIAILGVDEATVRRWNGRTFDAPDIARALRELRRHGALAVALDFPMLCDAQADMPGRAGLLAAMRWNGRVTLPFEFQRRNAPSPVPVPRALERFALAANSEGEPRKGAPRMDGEFALRVPADDLLDAAAGAGHLSFDFDRFGRARRLPLGAVYDGRTFPAMALATASVAGASPPSLDEPLLLPYPRAASQAEDASESGEAELPFDSVSLASALGGEAKWNELRGKVVVVGVTAPGMSARFPVPGGRASECELSALALDNLMGDQPLRRAPALWHWIFTLLPCLVVGGLSVGWRPVWSTLVAILCGLIVALVSLGVFGRHIWLDPSVPWTAIGATCLVGATGQLRRRERERVSIASTMNALAQVAEIVAVGKTPDELLQRVVSFAATTMRASGASAFLLDEARDELRIVAAIGPGSAPLIGQRLGAGEGIAGRVVREGLPLLVVDVPSEGVHAARFDRLTGLETRSILGVPLKNRGVVVGVLEVVNREGDIPFSEADLELLGAIANQAAVALDNVRLYDRLALRVEQSQDALADANRALQADKTLMQTVLHSMTDGVIVTDEEGRIQLVNAAATLLFPELGRDRLGEPLGHVLPDFPLGAIAHIHRSQVLAFTSPQRDASQSDSIPDAPPQARGESAPQQEARAEAALPEAALPEAALPNSTRSETRLELQANSPHREDNGGAVLLFRGSSEAPVAIEGHIAPLRGESGELAGLVAVFADVTQRREVEQAKSDFVSFVAHEMRSPLTSISGFSAMLQRGESGQSALPPPTRARFLGLIHGESERLTRLINTLLDVARLEAGRTIELNRNSVELEPLSLLALENQRAYSSRHTLKADFPPSLPPVFADADKVLQILINLLSNAQKYSPGGEITLGARARSDAGEVEVWVSDQGPGIAPEQRQLLFSRFGRAPQSAQGIGAGAKPMGTGLGLFLTKHLVEAHGGRIWVESKSGQGATFRFTLPCEETKPS
jgi:signal transduction histidine kinase/CHASE2 domain-containing sensor protein